MLLNLFYYKFTFEFSNFFKKIINYVDFYDKINFLYQNISILKVVIIRVVR